MSSRQHLVYFENSLGTSRRPPESLCSGFVSVLKSTYGAKKGDGQKSGGPKGHGKSSPVLVDIDGRLLRRGDERARALRRKARLKRRILEQQDDDSTDSKDASETPSKSQRAHIKAASPTPSSRGPEVPMQRTVAEAFVGGILGSMLDASSSKALLSSDCAGKASIPAHDLKTPQGDAVSTAAMAGITATAASSTNVSSSYTTDIATTTTTNATFDDTGTGSTDKDAESVRESRTPLTGSPSRFTKFSDTDSSGRYMQPRKESEILPPSKLLLISTTTSRANSIQNVKTDDSRVVDVIKEAPEVYADDDSWGPVANQATDDAASEASSNGDKDELAPLQIPEGSIAINFKSLRISNGTHSGSPSAPRSVQVRAMRLYELLTEQMLLHSSTLQYRDVISLDREAASNPWLLKYVQYVAILMRYKQITANTARRLMIGNAMEMVKFLQTANFDEVPLRRLARACAFFHDTLEDLPSTADAMRALVCECSGYETSEVDKRRSTFRIAISRTSMIANSNGSNDGRGTARDSSPSMSSFTMASPAHIASDASRDMSNQQCSYSDRDLFSAFAHAEALHPSATSPIPGMRSIRNSTYRNSRGSVVRGPSSRSSMVTGTRAASSSFIVNNDDLKNSTSSGSHQDKLTADTSSPTSAAVPTNTSSADSAASEPDNIDASLPVAKLIGWVVAFHALAELRLVAHTIEQRQKSRTSSFLRH